MKAKPHPPARLFSNPHQTKSLKLLRFWPLAWLKGKSSTWFSGKVMVLGITLGNLLVILKMPPWLFKLLKMLSIDLFHVGMKPGKGVVVRFL